MICDDFLRILRCPISHEPLQRADESLVNRLNQAVGDQQLKNRLGEKVEQTLEEGLVNEGRTWVFPVRDDIPCLLADEAIALAQLEESKDD
jgi:uncharacterized protein YbaR (Trm112 family)